MGDVDPLKYPSPASMTCLIHFIINHDAVNRYLFKSILQKLVRGSTHKTDDDKTISYIYSSDFQLLIKISAKFKCI